jgi:hypothetical protein
MRIPALFIGFVALGAVAACQPATTYNRGVEMSYHPSGKADAQEKLVNSAVEIKTDGDQKLIKDAGGIYLGELEVSAEKSTSYASGATGGGATLSGRVSLEVANRGGTHFYLAKLDTENAVAPASNGVHVGIGNSGGGETVQRTKARYVVYRVEQADWAKLDKQYQPDTPVNASPTAKAAGGKDGGT